MKLPMRWRPRLALAAAAALSLAAGCASEPGDTTGGDSSGSVGRLIAAEGPSGHQLRQVPAGDAPGVRKLEVASDSAGGWNLHLRTQRFQFTPAHAGGKVRAGEGHAHLYIDGEKYTRIYGPWFHLPAHALSQGRHTLTVTLNANDHSTWGVDGEPVQATSRITASGDGHDHHDTGHASPSSADTEASTAPTDEVLRIRIDNGEVTPASRRVKVDQGDRVRLIVTSGQPNRVHVHGYDQEAALEPASASTVDFVADRTGVFEVETHDPALQLLQLQVQ